MRDSDIAAFVDHDNSLLCRWLLHDSKDRSWIAFGSIMTLSNLIKMFSHFFKRISTSLYLGLNIVDFLAEILMKALYGLTGLGREINKLLKYAAMWAGIATVQDMNFTEQMVKNILSRMLTALRQLAASALSAITRNIKPVSIGIGGAWSLSSAVAF